MDYEAIAKRKISYSEDIFFLSYEDNFTLWHNSAAIVSFDNLDLICAYLFKNYINKRPAKRVYVYSTYFNELFRYFEEYEDIAFKIMNLKADTEPKAFQVYGGITFKDAKYYLGTDKTEGIKPMNYCELIKRFHNPLIRSSFTSYLKRFILDKEMMDFGSKENVPYTVVKELFANASLAPIIYSEVNKEYKNVYCYDFDSAYIAHYYKHKFPYKFTYCGKEIRGEETLVRARFINIKAKNVRFLPISTSPKRDGIGVKYANLKSNRFLMGKEVVLTFFYNLEMKIIDKYYDYDEMIIERCQEIEMRPLPLSFLRKVAELYRDKEEAKCRGESYADKKVLLNRIHGFFITSKEYNGDKEQMYPEVPLQISFYTIALQRAAMCDIIEEIGLENIISAHTDSIKTKGNFDEIIKEYNDDCRLVGFDKLGQLEFEGIMEKVVYFSNTRAKYIMDGEFKIKHGGIDDYRAKEILSSYTYETLNSTSPYTYTTFKNFESIGDKDILIRESEIRIFSEGGLLI